MAIAFDAESNSAAGGWTGSNGTTLSWSHTCTGTDRILLVGATGYYTSGGPRSVTGITYNGVALTKINSINGTADGISQSNDLWYLVAPATGSNTITITWSGAAQYASGSGMSYTGVAQTSPIDSNATGQSSSTGSGAATSLTLSTTVVNASCWVVGYVEARGGVISAGTATTLRGKNDSAYTSGGDSNGTVSTGSQSLQWTSTSGAWPGGVIASIKISGTAYTVVAALGTFTLTGIDAALKAGLNMIAALGTFTLTGIDALFSIGKGIIASVGSFVLTGQDSTFHVALSMVASVGTFTLTGIDALFHYGLSIIASMGSFVVNLISVRVPLILTGEIKHSVTFSSEAKHITSLTGEPKSNVD